MYRGASLIRNINTPRTTIGPQTWAYCRVIGRSSFLRDRYPRRVHGAEVAGCGVCGPQLQTLFFFTFVTGPRRSLSLKLGDTEVYDPQPQTVNQVRGGGGTRGPLLAKPPPYPMHPTPHTPRPTPCAPHPAPYTLNPTPFTLCNPYTVRQKVRGGGGRRGREQGKQIAPPSYHGPCPTHSPLCTTQFIRRFYVYIRQSCLCVCQPCVCSP